MRQQKIVASRFLVSSKFAPAITKSIQERVDEFTETRAFLSIYPFSANYSVKAAMGSGKRGGGGKRNAAADNKEKRKKDTKLKRLGIYCYDPNATRKPNQYFEIRPRFNLDGQLGDVPNVGWLDLPKTIKPKDYNQTVSKFLESKKEPKIIARPAKMNKRTGQLSVKALGPSIGSAFGNIGQVAARAIGIVVDGNGRMRCPPGVPAANQFTDDVGSNCFDFTPAVGRAVLQIVQNINQRILDDVKKIDAALPFVTGDSGEIIEARPEVLGRVRRGLASSSRVISGPTGELLGPDGRPITRPVPPSPEFARDVAEIERSGKKITPDMYEEEFGRLIRETYPELSEAEIVRLTNQAVQRQQMRDKQNSDVQQVLDLAKTLGVEIDPNDANSVQRGLLKTMRLLMRPENGGWDVSLAEYIDGDLDSDFDAAILEHQENQLELVLDVLMSEPQHFGLTNMEFQMMMSKYKNVKEFRKAMMEVLTGEKPLAEVFKEGSMEAVLAVDVMRKFSQLQQMEAGNFIGLISQRIKYPELMSNLTGLKLLDPFGIEFPGCDAVAFANTEVGGFVLYLNPMRVLLNNNFDTKSEDFTLFEPDGSAGTEVAKLTAMTKSIDRAGAERAREAYLSDLISLDELQQGVSEGNELQQRYIQKSMGAIGQAMYVMTHEITHGRQLMLVQNYLKSIPGLYESMTPREFFLLSENLISGAEKFYSPFGNDWDYSSIISNSDWLAGAIDNLPEIMQILIGQNAGGRYAMQHYYKAVFSAPFLSITEMNRQDLYGPLTRLRSEINSMDPNSTKYAAAVDVYNLFAHIYETDDYQSKEIIEDILSLRTQSALTIAEMQAELAAGVEAGFIKLTPEIEVFLGPLHAGKDITPDYGRTNTLAKPVFTATPDVIKENVKKKLKLDKFRTRRKERKLIDAAPDTLVGEGSTVEDALVLTEVVEGDYSDSIDRVKEVVEGLRSRAEVSRMGKIHREAVLENATTQQIENLEGDWRSSVWNSSDPVSWARALQSEPENVVNAVEQQFIPFMDLIDSSELPNDVVAEINLPPNSLDNFSSDQGAIISVGKHFTAVVHSAEDVGPNEVSTQSTQRLMILVPQGSIGLPDNTPGTQGGEVGALILPPGEIEIIGKTTGGVSIGRVVSQDSTGKQLNELNQKLNSLGTKESLPLSQRIVAKRAQNRVQRRQELARRPPARAAVMMEMDSRKSQLAQKIEYDPQTQKLIVSYRNGHRREFENVSYGRVRDAGASNKPDDLILELEEIPAIFNNAKLLSMRSGLASSTNFDSNNTQRSVIARERTLDILARAKDIGVDIDRQETRMGPRARADYLNNSVPAARSAIKLNELTSNQKENIALQAKDLKKSDLEIYRDVFGLEDNFGNRLSVAREIALARGDNELVDEIDDFVQEVSRMDDAQFLEAFERASNQIGNPFDERPVVLVGDPLQIVNDGRYKTTHQGMRTMGGRNPTDADSVRNTRMVAEAMLLGFGNDTDSDTQSLRPSSSLTMSSHLTEDRNSELKKIYGDDIEIQHNVPTAGAKGQEIAVSGSQYNKRSTGKAYGESSIILRPEVGDRTLIVNGDSVSDVGTSGGSETSTEVTSAAGRLTSINKNKEMAALFFDPAAIMFTAKTGRKNTIASVGQNSKQRYVEGLTLGSFENPDIQAIVSRSDLLRGDSIAEGKMNFPGVVRSASLTSFIGAARTRDRLLSENGIDVVIQSNFFDLDEVEPFNPAMTKKWVEKQISTGNFKDVAPEDLIGSENSTPYEAYLRYQKLNVERGGNHPFFDHPDNSPNGDEISEAKNRANFISMVDEEISRINTGDVVVDEKRTRGLASNTKIDENIDIQKARVTKAKNRLEQLQKAYEQYKQTGEWRGADFGVTMGLRSDYRSGDLDVFDGGKPTNLTKAELAEIEKTEKVSIEDEILEKIDKNKKELALQEFVSSQAEEQKKQGIIRFEDIPEEELALLVEEGKQLTPEDFKVGEGRRAAVHVGAPVLDGGQLDPEKTDGRLVDEQGNNNFAQAGNTGALNQRQLEIARAQRQEKIQEIDSRKQIIKQLKNPNKKITPKTQWEADHLNEKFGLRSQESKKKFEVGIEYDLNADWVTDEGLSRVIESMEKYLPEAQAEFDEDAGLFAKLDESPEMGFLSAYPVSEGLTTRGYWARNSHKDIPEDVATPLTEREAQQQTNDGRRRFLKVEDDDMRQRWEQNIRGSGYLVIGDKSNITSRFGPTGELQLVGKNKPIFGFSAKRELKDHSTVQLVGNALFARAIRLTREGREVNPSSVMTARRGQPLPASPEIRSRGLASSSSVTASSRPPLTKINEGPAEYPNGSNLDGTPQQLSIAQAEEKYGDSASKIHKYFKKKYGVVVAFDTSALKDKNDFTGRKEAMYGFLQSIEDVFENFPALREMTERDKIEFTINQDEFPIDDYSGTFQPLNKFFTRSKLGKNGGKSQITINLHKLKNDALWNINPSMEWSSRLVNDMQGNTYLWFGSQLIPEGFQMRYPEDAPDTQKEEFNALYRKVTQRMAYAIGVHEIAHYLDFATRDESDVSFPSKLSMLTRRMMGKNPSDVDGDLNEAFGSSSSRDEASRRMIEAADSVTQYGSTNSHEKFAEAFAAWFLFGRSQYVSKPQNNWGSFSSNADKKENFRKALEETLLPLMTKLGPRVKSALGNFRKNDIDVTTDEIPPAAFLYGMLPYFDVLNKNKSQSGKINRRLARRKNSIKKTAKENAFL